MEEIRLQKYFTDCGILSRRAAEREIENGHVTVNGEPAQLGQKIRPGEDTVLWNGKEIRPDGPGAAVVLMLNKPRGYLTSMSDDRGRKCVTELVADVPFRVYPIGRLDYDSEGLLLMTNDGELANLLTHPRHGMSKTYRVTVTGQVTDETLTKLRQPMTIDGYRLRPVEVRKVSEIPNHTILEFVLHEGRNRQVRKMCAEVGLTVKRLVRTAVGSLHLGSLKSGQWTYLNAVQTAYLRDASSVWDGQKEE